MTAWLRSQGYGVNHKRVARLLHLMGLEALCPKPHLSEKALDHPQLRVKAVEKPSVLPEEVTSTHIERSALPASIDLIKQDQNDEDCGTYANS
jgi:hypothetical protein